MQYLNSKQYLYNIYYNIYFVSSISDQYLGVVWLLHRQGLRPATAHPAQLFAVESDQGGGARLHLQLVP